MHYSHCTQTKMKNELWLNRPDAKPTSTDEDILKPPMGGVT